MKKLYYALASLLILLSCDQKPESKNGTHEKPTAGLKLKYATGFKVKTSENAKWVDVLQPYQGADHSIKYLLVQKGKPVPEHGPDIQVIEIPIDKIVCTSTTHIPLLDYLEETESLTGFPTTDYISSGAMRKRIEDGKVTDLGVDDELNMELLLDTEPDMVMAYSLSGDMGQFRKIHENDIPVVINAEYLERHPLGRAEWIKFMALFYNKEQMADSIFNAIENKYLSYKAITDTITAKPTVLSGVVYGDTWYMPGGKNYASKIIKDAGCNYLWSDTGSNGFLELSFEAVYEQAEAADFWIGVGSYKTLAAMKHADERYTEFNAYKKGNVFTYDARKGAKGGSEFLELGYLRPDIILADLIKITHPGLLPQHDLYFHAQLK